MTMSAKHVQRNMMLMYEYIKSQPSTAIRLEKSDLERL